MTDWAGLTGGTPDELKKRVDAAAVAAELGLDLEPVGGGRYQGHCPFHADESPSFAVWWDEERGHQRVGCWSCDFGVGDVFDLVRRLEGLNGFGDATKRVASLAAAGLPAPAPPPPAGPPPDWTGLAQHAHVAAVASSYAVRRLAFDRGVVAPGEWLIEEFRLGVNDAGTVVVVPHFGPDGVTCAAVKTRRAPGWTPTLTMPGSKLTELYGVWRDRGQPRVILCEGESDTWSAAWWFRDDPVTVVLGLPSGVAAHPRAEWVQLLTGRDVTLLFDADDAGRTGVGNWVDTLTPVAQAVTVALLDEGEDATSAGEERTVRAVSRGVTVTHLPPDQLDERETGYVRARDGVAVASFTLELKRVVEIRGEHVALDVQLPDGDEVTLTHESFRSDQAMKAWSNKTRYVWYRGPTEAQELYRMLLARRHLVPNARGVQVAGLTPDRAAFVTPRVTVGAPAWGYLPPNAKLELDENTHYEPGDWDPAALVHLARLHRPEVVRPVLGWTVAAHLRPTFDRFPILAVVGGAGTGKTTLLETVLGAFGSTVAGTLTASTPYGMFALVGSTNAVPVWLDEYRSEARKDTRESFEQVIRDAWTGGAALKGGLAENRQHVTELPVSAPIAVSGEDAFTEVSHVERMVLVRMPTTGRDPAALRAVQGTETGGLAHDLVSWLISRDHPAPPSEPERMDHARAVAAWGWNLLRAFTYEATGLDLGGFDGSLIEAVHREAAANPPVLRVIRAALNYPSSDGFPVWLDDGTQDVIVRVHGLTTFARRHTDIKLPGGASSVELWLRERYAVRDEFGSWGTVVRLVGARPEIFGG